MTQIKKCPKFKMTQIHKWTKFKNDPNSKWPKFKMTQIQNWPKVKNDQNSKNTQIKKWPRFKLTQIQKWPKLKKMTQKWSSLSLLPSAVVKGDQSSIYSKLLAFIYYWALPERIHFFSGGFPLLGYSGKWPQVFLTQLYTRMVAGPPRIGVGQFSG